MLVQPSEAISVTYLQKSASTSPVADVSHMYQSRLCHSHTSFNSFVANMRGHAFWEYACVFSLDDTRARHPRISRRSHYPRSKITQWSCILTTYLTGMTFSVTLFVTIRRTNSVQL